MIPPFVAQSASLRSLGEPLQCAEQHSGVSSHRLQHRQVNPSTPQGAPLLPPDDPEPLPPLLLPPVPEDPLELPPEPLPLPEPEPLPDPLPDPDPLPLLLPELDPEPDDPLPLSLPLCEPLPPVTCHRAVNPGRCAPRARPPASKPTTLKASRVVSGGWCA